MKTYLTIKKTVFYFLFSILKSKEQITFEQHI